MRRSVKTIWEILKETFREWNSDNAPRLGAALSYYTIFSIAPLLVLVIAVTALFLGQDAAQGKVFAGLKDMIGSESAALLQSAIAKAGQHGGGIKATILGLVTLLAGATGVMIELQAALNTVWKVMPKPGAGLRHFVRARLLSLALVVSLGFLLLVSLVMSAGLEALGGWLANFVPGWVILGYVINYGVLIGVTGLFFALMYKLLPDAKVAWRDVWIGALITSVLFNLGKYLIALYIGRASVASAFGAAGSLAVMLVWIYYSSQIVLLGAEFTRAYANRLGEPITPDDHAIEAPHAAPERLAAEKASKLGVPAPAQAERG